MSQTKINFNDPGLRLCNDCGQAKDAQAEFYMQGDGAPMRRCALCYNLRKSAAEKSRRALNLPERYRTRIRLASAAFCAWEI